MIFKHFWYVDLVLMKKVIQLKSLNGPQQVLQYHLTQFNWKEELYKFLSLASLTKHLSKMVNTEGHQVDDY